MRRLSRVTLEACIAGLFVCAAVAPFVAAQDAPQASSTSPVNPPPAQTPQPAASAATPAAAQPAPKKVWTNDDVRGLREDSRISTIGAAGAKPATQNGSRPANPRAKNAQWYQNRIAALEAKLPPIDGQIGQLQAALSGQTVNSVRKWGGARPDDWRVELADLQKKREGIQAEIAALKDQARHDGVPPGALP